MRFLSGVIVGALLLVGVAYLRDSAIDPARDPAAKTVVNWDVASTMFKTAGDWMREQADWIGQQLHRPG